MLGPRRSGDPGLTSDSLWEDNWRGVAWRGCQRIPLTVTLFDPGENQTLPVVVEKRVHLPRRCREKPARVKGVEDRDRRGDDGHGNASRLMLKRPSWICDACLVCINGELKQLCQENEQSHSAKTTQKTK